MDISASFGFDGQGVRFKVCLGLRALLVPDERGCAVAHVVFEASSYYLIMTGTSRMPVFIDRRI